MLRRIFRPRSPRRPRSPSSICSSTGLSSRSFFSSSEWSFTEDSTHDYLSSPYMDGEILLSPRLKEFTLEELKVAIGMFHPRNIINGYDFDHVFRGCITEQTSSSSLNPVMLIDVRKLQSENSPDYKDWITMLNYLSQFRHPHLAKLIGFSVKDDNWLLIHEALPNDSLARHLFERGPQPLSWATRVEVALGIAKGILFLHGDRIEVVHGNIRASNILLDSEFNAKLSDFSLSKRTGTINDKTWPPYEYWGHPDGWGEVHPSVLYTSRGGYYAPELSAEGTSFETDIYSFGVVLLELLTGRPDLDGTRAVRDTVRWVKSCSSNDKERLSMIMDSNLVGRCPRRGALKMLALALACTQYKADFRPKMPRVVRVLERLHQLKDGKPTTEATTSSVNALSSS